MDIHPPEPASPKGVRFEEAKNLAVLGDRSPGQGEHQPQNDVASGERAAGEFADDERVAEDQVPIQERSEGR